MKELKMGDKVTYPGGGDDYAVLCTDKFHLEGEDWYIMQIHKGRGEPHTFRADAVKLLETEPDSGTWQPRKLPTWTDGTPITPWDNSPEE